MLLWPLAAAALVFRRHHRGRRGYEGEREGTVDEDAEHPAGCVGRGEAVGSAEGGGVQGLAGVHQY